MRVAMTGRDKQLAILCKAKRRGELQNPRAREYNLLHDALLQIFHTLPKCFGILLKTFSSIVCIG